MVGLYVGWLDILEEAGPMLELIEVDRSVGPWGRGPGVTSLSRTVLTHIW